ncbi:translocase of chloroplast 120, chloroplastic-like [Ananas comosus]|uniref:Translocase of chloroplast 120, chloroplastic-like n=1 Tax=Ananas comosus TaxID=4615 RepID=A0A6P5EKH8_ANACO|nr:translocase of chloroplast 120, chloroplastic-like [Ananas comosus]XP_020084056.1 translocase of chloroplast 120, chloroplastic-like [Ananas comosus]
MENGRELEVGQRLGEAAEESVNGVSEHKSLESEHAAKDLAENEIFEEAVEPPPDAVSDLLIGESKGGGNAEMPAEEDGDEVEKFVESVEAHAISPKPKEQGQGFEEQQDDDSEDGNRRVREQEAKDVGGLDSAVEVGVEDGEQHVMQSELDSAESIGVADDVAKDEVKDSLVVAQDDDDEVIVENGDKPDGEVLDVLDSNGVNPDESASIVEDEAVNGGSVGVVLDQIRVNHDTESDKVISHAEVAQGREDSLAPPAILPIEQLDDLPSEATAQPDAKIAVDREIVEELPKENREEETVLVEDLDDSISAFDDDDDDDDKNAYNQPTPNAAPSRIESSEKGPNLPSQPAGLGSSSRLLGPSSRPIQQLRANGSASPRQSPQPVDPVINDESEENDETREKLQMIRVKFLRLAHRLGQTPHNVVVAQVLYRLGLAEQLRRNTNRPGVFSFDRASVMAEQLEAAGQEPLDFSCTIMVIGKSGVGKSATINSIFDEVKLETNAFQLGTKKVQEIVGTVQGIKVRVIDTPGLNSSSADQCRNEKILHSVKRFIKKSPPDIVLYFDRLDMQSRDYGDIPLLKTITDTFGSSIWFNAIIVLTHAASAPPDGANGIPLSYEMFVTQRSHVVQQAIRQAAGDVRLMNPVSLVENHSACRTNRAGQRVLPNGQVWKPQLLLLSFASKILAEANMLLKLQDSPPDKTFSRSRVPPLPFLLSSLLQSRPPLKLPEEQFGDDDSSLEEELGDISDSDDGSDYDDLPPFKRLTNAQLAKLSRAQKKAYYEELDYREKLFYKKQLKEERRRRKLMKKLAAEVDNIPSDFGNENVEDETGGSPASVPVPMPDLVLPASFDSDNPTHRYRFLDSSNPWLVRPVLETQGWDHDVGYEGLNVERLFVVKNKVPVSVSGQFTKDKKECTLQMELASSIKHSEGSTSSLGMDVQSVGKDMAYTLRGETRFTNFKRNNTAAGLSVTFLGDSVSSGLKIEDKLTISKQLRLLVSGGAMTGRGDVAYGGRLEATLRDKDYPIGRMLSTLALSVVDWHGELVVGCNVQSQLPLGRGTNLIGHANLNNKGTGQVGIRLNSSDQLQIALIALIPIFRNIKRMLFDSSQAY